MQNNNSKLNTILLVIVVILLGIGIWKFGVKKESVSLVQTSCVIGGCNSSICYDPKTEGGNSICIALPEYACYKNATCERQNTGKCGWTQTSQLQRCLDSFKTKTSDTPLIQTWDDVYVASASPVFTSWFSKQGGVDDYKVNKITFVAAKATEQDPANSYFSASDSIDAFIVDVNFSVKPTSGQEMKWQAGNGDPISNGWINNKTLFVTIDKNASGFYFKTAGTGL